MKTEEFFMGQLVDAITTKDDADACAQLMERTGQYLNMVEHCAKFHRKVLSAGYLAEVLGDIDELQLRYGLPQPMHPALQ